MKKNIIILLISLANILYAENNTWLNLKNSYDKEKLNYNSYWATHKKIDFTLINKIPDDKLYSVLADCASYIILNRKNNDDYNSVMKLNKYLKMAYILWWLEGEINNGGYHQYYYNSAGEYVFEAIEYLDLIKAAQFKKITEDSLNIVNNKDYTPEVFRIHQRNGTLGYYDDDKAVSSLDKLDKMFYKYPDNIDKLFVGYVRKNLKEDIEY